MAFFSRLPAPSSSAMFKAHLAAMSCFETVSRYVMLPSTSLKESPRGSTFLRNASTVSTDSLYREMGAASPRPTVPSAPVNSTTTVVAEFEPDPRAMVQVCAILSSTRLKVSFTASNKS